LVADIFKKKDGDGTSGITGRIERFLQVDEESKCTMVEKTKGKSDGKRQSGGGMCELSRRRWIRFME